MPDEIWRRIPGYPDYEVSDLGNVRSYRGRWGGRGVPRDLLPHSHKTGYLTVMLHVDGERPRTWRIYRLVMLAFVGPLPKGMQTRHLDGDKLNNALVNLAYGTTAENQRDAVLHGVHHNARKTHCAKGHLFDETNTIRRAGGNRRCRTCQLSYQRRYDQRRRSAA